ncbi:MAG: energy-coupling factor ABC transporter permease [Erysipelotrichaceae bacterium]
MADALLSPVVGVAMYAVSTGALARSTSKINSEVLEKKIPIMAVAGSFVFAAQMINFTIPATGSSGHIGGGILLAAMLGGYPALMTIAAVLSIQSLFFADGGLLALGANIFNLGVIPCLIVYPLIFKPLIKKGINKKSLTIASIIAVIVALQLGALGVVVETVLSQISMLPMITFAMMMQPIHLAIGLVEGLVTAGILVFVFSMRPEILESSSQDTIIKRSASLKKVLTILLIGTLLLGGVVSIFASTNPDGLEWSITKVTGVSEIQAKDFVHTLSSSIQKITAFMPKYNHGSNTSGSINNTTVAGLVGSGLTFLVAGSIGLAITKAKKKKKLKST